MCSPRLAASFSFCSCSLSAHPWNFQLSGPSGSRSSHFQEIGRWSEPVLASLRTLHLLQAAKASPLARVRSMMLWFVPPSLVGESSLRTVRSKESIRSSRKRASLLVVHLGFQTGLWALKSPTSRVGPAPSPSRLLHWHRSASLMLLLVPFRKYVVRLGRLLRTLCGQYKILRGSSSRRELNLGLG